MKRLLTKIRSASPKQKCQLADEVYVQVTMVLQNLYKQLNQTAPAGFSAIHIVSFEQPLDEIEEIFNGLENLLSSLDSKEIARIRENIEKDYNETLEIWKFYEILNPDDKTYTADYDGRAEAGQHGKNSPAGPDFTGQKFAIPTLPEILNRLKPAEMKLYRQMEKEGLQPKLQIAPIAFNIRTLGQKINAKRAELKINTSDTYVWNNIKDSELLYAPTSIRAIKGGSEIKITGGQSKSSWIKQNQGFLIDLVPTKPELTADPAIQKDQQGNTNHNAVQTEKHAAKAKHAGYTPMSYESYLSAVMRAIKAGKPLEDDTFTLLLDSNLIDTEILASGCWASGCVSLYGGNAVNQSVNLHLRSSVRLK